MKPQSMLFHDRRDAGVHLAKALARFAPSHPLVLALPRGGVPVAFEVARALGAIRDAGLPCQQVIDSGPMPGTTAPSAAWRAQCEDKAYHLIQIQPDGSAVVASRTNP